ncbi:MAG: hypothetical protein JWM82_4436, partial [Myxococcales bacterium]|nr:hypothetical protein [Myxococcales bacterium]
MRAIDFHDVATMCVVAVLGAYGCAGVRSPGEATGAAGAGASGSGAAGTGAAGMG